MNYGKATVGIGTTEMREIDILNYLQAQYKDHRLISIAQVEDDVESFIVTVENPESTGRATKQSIWLSKESLMGFVSAVMLYFTAKKENLDELLKNCVSDKEIGYSVSDNIKVIE